jgi:ABC-type transporter Mla subunit MlaD
VLAANLANFGRIGVIYSKSLEQALVIFPALIAALATVAGGVPSDEGGSSISRFTCRIRRPARRGSSRRR